MTKKYESLNEIQLELLKKGVIDLTDDVNSNLADYIRECMIRLNIMGNPDITISITSDGGNVGAGLCVYDMIRLYPGRKTGVVIGFARSMAVTILQACDTRKCHLHSRILIHNVSIEDSITIDKLKNPEKIKEMIDDMEASQKRIYQIIKDKTGKTEDEIVIACQKDSDMTSEEALEFGLIDEII
jgi:ATP-dependent Clp protease, protease subunit